MRRPHSLVLLFAVACLEACASSVVPLGASLGAHSVAQRLLVIRHQHHRVYTDLRIASADGDCVTIENSFDITIEASQIGPCGGNGVVVTNAHSIRIFDSYIHPETRSPGCCDHNDGVLVQHSTGVTIQGNVIGYGESNVEAPQDVTGLTVTGNFLLNPRGPYPRGQNVQAWNSRRVDVRNNYTLSSPNTKRFLYPDDQEDSINFGIGSHFSATSNYVTGGHSTSGCGLIADNGADNVRIAGNVVVNSGQCGIGVASGTGQAVTRNRVYNRNPVPGGGNTAIYVWNQYPSLPCGPVDVAHNVATEIRKDKTQSGFWNGGGCDPVRLEDNTWDRAAQKRLTPVREKLPPPPIPPQPRRCVIPSPYSTQTKWPACGEPAP